MRLAFVTPAWRRPAVTALALAQRRQLCDGLAARGITATCTIIADDENKEIAKQHGFGWIHMENHPLGRKINAGFQQALDDGADYVSFVGSDNWLHPDLFKLSDLEQEFVITGRSLCQYDLATGRSKIVTTRSVFGVIPWLIPRIAFARGKILSNECDRGIDINIGFALSNQALQWVWHDPHPLARVDFKSDINMTPFGAGAGEPGPDLMSAYPAQLVEMADEFREVAA